MCTCECNKLSGKCECVIKIVNEIIVLKISVNYLCQLSVRVMWELETIPADFRHEPGYTVGIYYSANTEANNHSHSYLHLWAV